MFLSLLFTSFVFATNPPKVTAPKLRQQVALSYPKDAPLGLQGDVVIQVTVSETGKVSKVVIISGPEAFHQEAIRAGYKLDFQAASKDGKAVAATTQIHFHFAPKKSNPPKTGDFKELVIVSERADEVSTLSKATIDEKQLEKTAGQQLAETVSQIPGVNTAPSLAGNAKPIIRGQAERRLLLLYDNIRHESQKWGPDHAPEIDPFAAGEINIIKGAAATRYGADAIGGVILVSPPPLRNKPGVGGKTVFMGATNGRQGYGATRLDWVPENNSNVATRIEGNFLRAGSLQAPNYVLGNTARKEFNVGTTLQYRWEDNLLRLNYHRYQQKAGVFFGVQNSTMEEFTSQLTKEPLRADQWEFTYEIERPYQWVSHDVVSLHSHFTLSDMWSLEGIYAFQMNDRREFEQVRDNIEGPQYDFTLRTHSLDLHANHEVVYAGEASVEGGFGIQGMFQENVYRGYELIPNFRSFGGSIFFHERIAWERFTINTGARYDQLRRTTYIREAQLFGQTKEGNLEEGQCPEYDYGVQCSDAYHNTSLSIGGLWHAVKDHVDLKIDLSKASRTPNIDELFLLGYAPSFPVYAVGDPRLNKETTYGVSPTLGIRYAWFQAEASTFLNYIEDFIYFAPEIKNGTPRIAETIRGSWPRYKYNTIDAYFYGIDGFVELGEDEPLGLQVQGSNVQGINNANGDHLVGIPADQLTLTGIGRPPVKQPFHSLQVGLKLKWVRQQFRVDPTNDFAAAPPGYQLLGAFVDSEIKKSDRNLRIGLLANNLLNTAYRQYTSLLRYYADQPGRDIQLRLTTNW